MSWKRLDEMREGEMVLSHSSTMRPWMNGVPEVLVGNEWTKGAKGGGSFPLIHDEAVDEMGHPSLCWKRLDERREGEMVLSHSSTMRPWMNGAPIVESRME